SREQAPLRPVRTLSPSAITVSGRSGAPAAPASPVTAVTRAPAPAGAAGPPAASAARSHATRDLPLIGQVCADGLAVLVVDGDVRVLEAERAGDARDPVVDDRPSELGRQPVRVVDPPREGVEGAGFAVVAVREAPEPRERDRVREVVAGAERGREAVGASAGAERVERVADGAERDVAGLRQREGRREAEERALAPARKARVRGEAGRPEARGLERAAGRREPPRPLRDHERGRRAELAEGIRDGERRDREVAARSEARRPEGVGARGPAGARPDV